MVEIIANDQGHRITPSWVSFTDDERLYDTIHSTPAKNTHIRFSVGDSAKNAFHSNPENTVFDAKRLIGRKMDDQDITRDMKHWPFKVTEKNGKPAITVKHKGGDRDFVSYRPRYNDWYLTWLLFSVYQTPEEISAMVLTKMKETAEAYLGHKVTHAVVTVPACKPLFVIPLPYF